MHSLTPQTPMTRWLPICSRHLFETDESTHILDEIDHSDLAPRANDADDAHDLGSHSVLLVAENMLDASADF